MQRLFKRGCSTIYAVATGIGPSAIAIIRVSGPKANRVITSMTGNSNPVHRVLFPTDIRHPASGELLDSGMAVWMRAPATFTGEDVCELHVHGSPAVLRDTLSALGSMEGLNPAEPGQFTKRAFMNGKMDLTMVEGLRDLLRAETSVQRRLAIGSVKGQQKRLLRHWRDELLKSVAQLEAFIDFGEEHLDAGAAALNQEYDRLLSLHRQISNHINDCRIRERIRQGVLVVLLGNTNVGKSSLLNAISGTDSAIVSPSPGTTRDRISVHVDVQGMAATITDTAGIRCTPDPLEGEGIRRAVEAAEMADILYIVLDAGRCRHPEGFAEELRGTVDSLPEELSRRIAQGTVDVSVVCNKMDLLAETDHRPPAVLRLCGQEVAVLRTSCAVDNGLDRLREHMAAAVRLRLEGNSASDSAVAIDNWRMRCLIDVAAGVFQGLDVFHKDLVLAAHCLRWALQDLAKLSGQVTTEHILDLVFRDFCIGK